MKKIIQTALDTSEVWALLIPLSFLSFKKIKKDQVREIITYLWVALVLNIIIVIISYLPDFTDTKKLPFLLQNNTIEYNIHSVVRVLAFTLFFMRISNDKRNLQKKILLGIFLLLTIINFLFFESPVDLFSSRLFTLEAIVLLFFCIYYYLSAIAQERTEKISSQPAFWIITGLSIYEAVNFFIFLLFTYLVKNYTVFAQHIWNFHNISFIILCIFITKGFYESGRK